MTSLRLAVVAAVAALALVGCGSDDEPKVTPKSESLPTCAEVWVVGKVLPKDYDGCVDGDGVLQVSQIRDCTSDAGKFTTYDEKFFAILGQKIGTGFSSPEYDAAYTSCFTGDW